MSSSRSPRKRCLNCESCEFGIPLVSPFRTSFGVETGRDILVVRVETDDAQGWAECVALADPLYSSE